MGLAMVPFDAEKIKIKLLYRSEKLEEWNNIPVKSEKIRKVYGSELIFRKYRETDRIFFHHS